MTERECKVCGERKSLPSFPKNGGYRRHVCSLCYSKRQFKYQRSRADRGICKQCNSPTVSGKTLCKGHLEYSRGYNAKLRLDALNAYGGPICSCCDETQDAFLSIDHIEGKGCQHRKRIGVPSGTPFYAWLRRNGYPKGFRVLCANCNMAFSKLGYCPHEFETQDKFSLTVPVFENSDAISQKPALVN